MKATMVIRLPLALTQFIEGTQDYADKSSSLDWYFSGKRHKDGTVTVQAPVSDVMWFADHLWHATSDDLHEPSVRRERAAARKVLMRLTQLHGVSQD